MSTGDKSSPKDKPKDKKRLFQDGYRAVRLGTGTPVLVKDDAIVRYKHSSTGYEPTDPAR